MVYNYIHYSALFYYNYIEIRCYQGTEILYVTRFYEIFIPNTYASQCLHTMPTIVYDINPTLLQLL